MSGQAIWEFRMKPGCNDVEVVSDDAGTFIGLALGWDHTAEHEWGIRGLVTAFGLPHMPSRTFLKKVVGVDARKVTQVPNGLIRVSDPRGYEYLAYGNYWPKNVDGEYLDRVMQVRTWREEPMHTAWDADSFGVRLPADPEGASAKILDEMLAAFNRCDTLIYRGGRDIPFANAGLLLVIASRLPKETKDAMASADSDWLDLEDAVKKTGIREKLQKAGKKYFALKPAWASTIQSTKDGEVSTKHRVIFFLNPEDQRNNNFGWFTVEQLLEWIEGTGPVPKKKKEVA
jgi:hypothetical protein